MRVQQSSTEFSGVAVTVAVKPRHAVTQPARMRLQEKGAEASEEASRSDTR